jgi:hypothetical protein
MAGVVPIPHSSFQELNTVKSKFHLKCLGESPGGQVLNFAEYLFLVTVLLGMGVENRRRTGRMSEKFGIQLWDPAEKSSTNTLA